MIQTELFEQRKQLERVTSAIGLSVLTFCRSRGIGGTFHASELHGYVGNGVAPASADRILRNLRASGHLNYEIVNRRASFYKVTMLAEDHAAT